MRVCVCISAPRNGTWVTVSPTIILICDCFPHYITCNTEFVFSQIDCTQWKRNGMCFVSEKKSEKKFETLVKSEWHRTISDLDKGVNEIDEILKSNTSIHFNVVLH